MASDPRFSIEEEPPQRGRGCLFYGCITLVVLSVLAAVGLFFAVRFLSGVLQKTIDQYTAAAPAQLPPLNVPAAERRQIIDRVEDFRRLVETPAGPNDAGVLTDEQRTLELTADEINVLLDDERDLKGRARVAINGDKLQGEISIPLDELPLMGGRYLNGRATIVPSAVNGRLQVRLTDVEVKGQPLPKEIQDALDQENVIPDNRPPGDRSPPVRALESVEVVNGTLRVVFAKEPGEAAPEPAEPPVAK
jgi:hypothetical protein